MARKHIVNRIKQRSDVTQILYAVELTERNPLDIVDAGLYPPIKDEDDKVDAKETIAIDEYGRLLLQGITEKKEFLDQRISHASDNWSIDRMPAVDRSILRLAAYEMLYVDEIPVSVAINEAVDLAKKFGGDDSPRFVNGILGKIANAPASEQAKFNLEPVVRTTAEDLEQPTEAEAVAAIMEAISSHDGSVELVEVGPVEDDASASKVEAEAAADVFAGDAGSEANEG